MNKREKMLALIVALVVGGWALLNWVVDPLLAGFDTVKEESAQIEQDLSLAQTLVDNDTKIRKQWKGYEQAGLARSLELADSESRRAILVWADKAHLSKVKLSDGKEKTDDDKPFGELTYTIQATGKLGQIYDLLTSVHESPFPLRIEKCIIDVQNSDGENLQLSLTVSTLFTPEAKSK